MIRSDPALYKGLGFQQFVSIQIIYEPLWYNGRISQFKKDPTLTVVVWGSTVAVQFMLQYVR